MKLKYFYSAIIARPKQFTIAVGILLTVAQNASNFIGSASIRECVDVNDNDWIQRQCRTDRWKHKYFFLTWRNCFPSLSFNKKAMFYYKKKKQKEISHLTKKKWLEVFLLQKNTHVDLQTNKKRRIFRQHLLININ